MSTPNALTHWLESFVAKHAGVAGSVHVREDDLLVLHASLNLPPKVVEVTRTIPKGKGMAGLAWERDRAVATCNLKTDQSGDVRPGAKAVNAQGAVAIPVRDDQGGLRAVVGIAFATERDFDDAALASFEREASTLPTR